MDFSKESWRKAIEGRAESVSDWLKSQLRFDMGNRYWSDDCVCLSREEQEILYARMMIEVPEEEET